MDLPRLAFRFGNRIPFFNPLPYGVHLMFDIVKTVGPFPESTTSRIYHLSWIDLHQTGVQSSEPCFFFLRPALSFLSLFLFLSHTHALFFSESLHNNRRSWNLSSSLVTSDVKQQNVLTGHDKAKLTDIPSESKTHTHTRTYTHAHKCMRASAINCRRKR